MLAPYIDLEIGAATAMEARPGAHCALRLTFGDNLRTGRVNLFLDSLETAERLLAVLAAEVAAERARAQGKAPGKSSRPLSAQAAAR